MLIISLINSSVCGSLLVASQLIDPDDLGSNPVLTTGFSAKKTVGRLLTSSDSHFRFILMSLKITMKIVHNKYN